MLPIWGYVAVAAAIAGLSFAIGQIAPGSGVVFAALASTLWTAYAAYRGRSSIKS